MTGTFLHDLQCDLGHRVLFDGVYPGSGLTRAVERIGLAPPTVGIRRAWLRRQLSVPLFMRTSVGVRSTPCAGALIGPVHETLTMLRSLAADAVSPCSPSASAGTARYRAPA